MSDRPLDEDGNAEIPLPETGRPDANVLARANLDFLLSEIQIWERTQRIPASFLDTLTREYTARRAALDPMPTGAPEISGDVNLAVWPVEGHTHPVAPPPPTIPPTPPKAPSPSPIHQAWSFIAEFLEERNIAALHIVGSLLLLTGLLVMIRWQWQGWGRGLLVLVLAAASAGLYQWGRNVSEKSHASRRVLVALGALILPLDLVAARLFGFLGGDLLNTEASGLVISAACAGIYLITLRRMRHPLFGGMIAVALGMATFFLPRAFLPAQSNFLPMAHALTLLPLAYGYFKYAGMVRQNGDTAFAQPFTMGGHFLIASAFVLSLLNGLSDNQRLVQSFVALSTAIIYADTGIRLRLSRLTYPATFCILLCSQLVFGQREMWAERGCALALAALLLQALSAWYERQAAHFATDTEIGATFRDAFTIYGKCGLWTARLTLIPFFLSACFHLFTFTLSSNNYHRLPALVASLIIVGVFVWSALQKAESQLPWVSTQRAIVYPALAALLTALSTLGGFLGAWIPLLTPWFTPSLCGGLATVLYFALSSLARRGKLDELASVLEEAARGVMVLTLALPWLTILHLLPSLNQERTVSLFGVLPALALFTGLLAARRDRGEKHNYLHLAVLALGSLSLYFGASVETASPEIRCLWSSLGGSILALALAIVAGFLPNLRRSLSQDAGILAVICFLPLFAADTIRLFTASENGLSLSQAGIALLLALVWGSIARVRREPAFLYGAGLMLLASIWWVSSPLETTLHYWPATMPNPTRWFLYSSPVLVLIGFLLRAWQRTDTADFGLPIFRTALAAAIVGGLGQVGNLYGILGGGEILAESAVGHLYLLALGFSVCALVQRRLRFVYAAEGALFLGYLPYQVNSFTGPWALSPYWSVLTLILVGSAALFTARSKQGTGWLIAAQAGAIFLLSANGHLVHLWIPQRLHYAWAILFLPLLAYLGYWEKGYLRKSVWGISQIVLALFVVDLCRWQAFVPSVPVAHGYLVGTFLVYAVLSFAVAWWKDRKDWLQMAVWSASIGILLWRSGYPAVTTTLESAGFDMAVAASIWFGVSCLLARTTRRAFEAAVADIVLWLTVAAIACGFWGGMANHGAESKALLTLLISGGLQSVLAYRRPRPLLKHLAFTSFFAAAYLWLSNHMGLSLDTLDLILFPLGLYLVGISVFDLYGFRQQDRAGTALPQIAARDEARAIRACAFGLSFLLGPSLLAVWTASGALWHPYLLVIECLISITIGIAYRFKLFLGFGLSFLVAFLALKAYQAIQIPGQQLQFAFYLLLLGGLALAVGIFFDRQRGLLIRAKAE